MSIRFKIARIYLFVVAVYYLFMGIGALPDNLLPFSFKFLFLGIWGTFIGMTPVRFLQFNNIFTDGLSNPYVMYLGVIAIIFSIIALIALKKMRSNQNLFVSVWGFLSILSLAIGIDNWIYGNGLKYYELDLAIGVLYDVLLLLFPISLIIATFLIQKDLRHPSVENSLK